MVDPASLELFSICTCKDTSALILTQQQEWQTLSIPCWGLAEACQVPSVCYFNNNKPDETPYVPESRKAESKQHADCRRVSGRRCKPVPLKMQVAAMSAAPAALPQRVVCSWGGLVRCMTSCLD